MYIQTFLQRQTFLLAYYYDMNNIHNMCITYRHISVNIYPTRCQSTYVGVWPLNYTRNLRICVEPSPVAYLAVMLANAICPSPYIHSHLISYYSRYQHNNNFSEGPYDKLNLVQNKMTKQSFYKNGVSTRFQSLRFVTPDIFTISLEQLC